MISLAVDTNNNKQNEAMLNNEQEPKLSPFG
jgi:hypothetical protein